MATQVRDLWSLTLGRPQIDPNDLADAVAQQATEEHLDYRTRLLIHESVEALQVYWGPERLSRWLQNCPHREEIEAIWRHSFEETGFPSLRRRLMEKTRPETIRQFLAELGFAVRSPLRIYIAGSVALMLPGYLERRTEDIDLIDEVPKVLRENHSLLHQLEARYGLHLGHVQRHYFPPGWDVRAHSYEVFNHLQVFLVDVYDVFLSKLFSVRDKDKDDMRLLVPQLSKEMLVERFKTTCEAFLAAPRLVEIATQNWQLLFGEGLPS
jgi:hypothetical protein